MVRLMQYCGLPNTDLDFIHCDGIAMEHWIKSVKPGVIQFTGSSLVGERLAKITNGKVRLEDAGFDWKILGPDVGDENYVAYMCDHDAYSHTGQKCSA